jgi:membrane dipeptidase
LEGRQGEHDLYQHSYQFNGEVVCRLFYSKAKAKPNLSFVRFSHAIMIAMKLPPHILLDAHLDIAMNAVAEGRDFRQPTWVTQRREGKFLGAPSARLGVASVGLPNLLLGRTALVFATLWVKPLDAKTKAQEARKLAYQTPQEAYQKALKQMDYYQRLADEDARVRLIKTQRDLDAVLETWQADKDFTQHQVGLVILMEGADPVLEPRQVEEWVERGVRILGLAWRATRYAAGTGAPGPLTPLGRELLDVMADYGLILDLSHLAELAYYEALERYQGPVLASHSNPRRFVQSDRHLSDEMIRRLVARGGVMGVVPYNVFLKQGWTPENNRKSDVSVARVLEAIDHVCQVAGSAEHVGLGTDWDGGFGAESIPAPWESHLDLYGLDALLAQRGYTPPDIEAILCGNFLRVLRQGLPR